MATTNYGWDLPIVGGSTDTWGTIVNAAFDAVDASLKTVDDKTQPVGSIVAYGGTSAPTGWLFCYGQEISRTTYASLFSAIGTTYGSGNGSTTFNVPDIRGRVIAGQDDMGGSSANRLTGQTGGVNGDTLGGAGGAETHTLTSAQMPTHTHTASTSSNGTHTHTVSGTAAADGAHTHTYGQSALSFGYASGTGAGNFNSSSASTSSNGTHTHTVSGTAASNGAHTHTVTVNNAGSGGAHNNVQPTLILNYIIYAAA